MQFTVYHPAERRLFVGRRGTASPFGHTWGGAASYAGLVPAPGRPAVHLFFRLNTADPSVGVSLPSATRLPLLCAVRYGATALGYRVVSDSAVELLRLAEPEPWDGFPSANYPERLRRRPVTLTEAIYDPEDVAGAQHGSVFGYAHLTPAVRAAAAQGAFELAGMFGVEYDRPEDALADAPGPFLQGRPVEHCPAPGCANHGRPASLHTVAVFAEGRPGYRKLWGPNGGDLQIVWQLCPACGAVQATNACT